MRRPEETTQPEVWDGVLGLLDLEVVHYHFDEERGVRQMTVVPRMQTAACPDCGSLCDGVHQTRDRDSIRDLPISDRPVELRIRVWQFACSRCDRKFTPTVASVAEGAHATERFLERCAALVRISDIANAAAFLGVPEKTLEGWYYDYVERIQAGPQPSAAPIRAIGIDELSQKKGTAVSSP